jgi:hypothetical protein
MTGNKSIIRHSYKVERVTKVYAVYELTGATLQTKSGNMPINPVLTKLIRIEDFRHYSRANGIDKYLRLRNTKNWQSCEKVTGLYLTSSPGLFYGDRRFRGRNFFLVFQFSENREQLTIDYYLGYCPYRRPEQITGDLRAILSKYIK